MLTSKLQKLSMKRAIWNCPKSESLRIDIYDKALKLLPLIVFMITGAMVFITLPFSIIVGVVFLLIRLSEKYMAPPN